LFDDDTGSPINLSGTTLANPGSSFTSSAWTVTDGAIVTTSTTPITIPTFPIGSQLSALSLTVGAGLGIKPGDPITIADTATGLNTMVGYVTSYTSSNGTLVCQIGWTFQFEIRGETPNNTGSGYIAWYDFGTPDDQGPILVAGLGNGITIIDIGYFQISILESVFKTILDVPYNSQSNTYARTFLACMTMTDSVNTRQIFTGRLPILYGGTTN
jgi:hypothetical protein